MNPVRPHWFYTYVLNSQHTKTFYTGTTNNLERRLEEHQKGKVCYIKNREPFSLVYFEACLNKDDAYPVRNGISNWTYRRERYLKTGMGKRCLKNRLRGGLTG